MLSSRRICLDEEYTDNAFIRRRWTAAYYSNDLQSTTEAPKGTIIKMVVKSCLEGILNCSLCSTSYNGSSQTKPDARIALHLEHIIISIHVHVIISRLDENKTCTFRSRLPYL